MPRHLCTSAATQCRCTLNRDLATNWLSPASRRIDPATVTRTPGDSNSSPVTRTELAALLLSLPDNSANNIDIVDSIFEGNVGAGIYASEGAQYLMTGNVIEGNGGPG